MKIDLSIITSTSRPASYRSFIYQMATQLYKGINVEHIIVQEGAKFDDFYSANMVNLILKRQPLHNDFGATAKDVGLSMANGEYVCFFDDDNIYYPNAISTVYSTVLGHDIGICRVHYKDSIIPPRTGRSGSEGIIESGKIDSMCFAVKTDLAKQFKWAGGGRFSDIRYLEKVKLLSCDIRFNNIIIGEHL